MSFRKIVLISILSFIMGILITDYHSYQEQGEKITKIYKETNPLLDALLKKYDFVINPNDIDNYEKEYYISNNLQNHSAKNEIKEIIQFNFYAGVIYKSKNKDLLIEFAKIVKDIDKKELSTVNLDGNTVFYISLLFMEPEDALMMMKRYFR